MINRYISQFKMDKLLRQGVEHFNERLFYEAHEFWRKFGMHVTAVKKHFSRIDTIGRAGVHYQKQRNEPAKIIKISSNSF